MPEEKYKICQSNNARGRNLKSVKALTPAGICDKVLPKGILGTIPEKIVYT